MEKGYDDIDQVCEEKIQIEAGKILLHIFL
jgi:hypothetical protein